MVDFPHESVLDYQRVFFDYQIINESALMKLQPFKQKTQTISSQIGKTKWIQVKKNIYTVKNVKKKQPEPG